MTSITTYITCDGAANAIEFYGKAFGAVERYRIPMEGGRVGHAEITIGDTILMISDEAPEYGAIAPTTLKGSSCSLVLECDDPDATFQQALKAGAKAERPMRDEPYGRAGWLLDPFGHRWSIMRSNPGFDPASLV
jgi:PhnB protein